MTSPCLVLSTRRLGRTPYFRNRKPRPAGRQTADTRGSQLNSFLPKFRYRGADRDRTRKPSPTALPRLSVVLRRLDVPARQDTPHITAKRPSSPQPEIAGHLVEPLDQESASTSPLEFRPDHDTHQRAPMALNSRTRIDQQSHTDARATSPHGAQSVTASRDALERRVKNSRSSARTAGAVNQTLPPALVTAIHVASKSSRSFDEAACDESTGTKLTASTPSGVRTGKQPRHANGRAA